MTQFEGLQSNESAFNTRADSAALRLKGQLSKQLSAMTGERVELPSTPVQVGADGQPLGQMPPDGSYAREQLEQRRQLAALQAQMQAQAQQFDPRLTQQTLPVAPSPQEPSEQLSQRAETRISQLVDQLRQKDRELQQVQTQHQQTSTSAEELRAQLTAANNAMQGMMEQNLAHLSPEDRMQVLSDARIRQAVAQSEQRVLQTVRPQLEALQLRNIQLEKVRIAGRYPGYDPRVHDELIDEFRSANANCSVEQAFRAVATPEELAVGGAGRANAPPPSVPPGNGALNPRYLPNQAQQADPLEEMRGDARRAAELARSADPRDQKLATALWHKNLSERLGMQAPR